MKTIYVLAYCDNRGVISAFESELEARVEAADINRGEMKTVDDDEQDTVLVFPCEIRACVRA